MDMQGSGPQSEVNGSSHLWGKVAVALLVSELMQLFLPGVPPALWRCRMSCWHGTPFREHVRMPFPGQSKEVSLGMGWQKKTEHWGDGPSSPLADRKEPRASFRQELPMSPWAGRMRPTLPSLQVPGEDGWTPPAPHKFRGQGCALSSTNYWGRASVDMVFGGKAWSRAAKGLCSTRSPPLPAVWVEGSGCPNHLWAGQAWSWETTGQQPPIPLNFFCKGQ